jgi:hypothetical protein
MVTNIFHQIIPNIFDSKHTTGYHGTSTSTFYQDQCIRTNVAVVCNTVTVKLSRWRIAIRPRNKPDGCHHAFKVQNLYTRVNSFKECCKVKLAWGHAIMNLALIPPGLLQPNGTQHYHTKIKQSGWTKFHEQSLLKSNMWIVAFNYLLALEEHKYRSIYSLEEHVSARSWCILVMDFCNDFSDGSKFLEFCWIEFAWDLQSSCHNKDKYQFIEPLDMIGSPETTCKLLYLYT